MLIVFIHGWSVTSTDAYGALPAALATNAAPKLRVTVEHLYLGKYVSFADEVNVDDIARAMQRAVNTEILPRLAPGERFACIAHSAGALVVRQWIDVYFKKNLDQCPLQHLVMLAPANHGSALAQLGKGRLSRMKFFLDGVQPGAGVLDWLELGSDHGWALNQSWFDYRCLDAGLYVYVLTGQSIDRGFYDHLNSYSGEVGSDGVVRAAAANMNYGMIRLSQQNGRFKLVKEGRTENFAFGILPGCAHSGEAMGIMRSVQSHNDASHPAVRWISRCLEVRSAASYRTVLKELGEQTQQTQQNEREIYTRDSFLFERKFVTRRYCMLIFNIFDDRDNRLVDYDVIFTAGPSYNENHLPPGFFVDRQRNKTNLGKLTYYIDYDVMADWFAKPAISGKFGFKVAARPASGFSYYSVAEHRGTFANLKRYFEPNQTLMVEIQLTRHVVEGVFRLTHDIAPENFQDQAKGGELA